MTGNPAALASALMKVSDGLVAIPQQATCARPPLRDAFHLLPVARRAPVQAAADASAARARIARLERLERTLQHG